MNTEKCNALKEELFAAPEPLLVPIARFFDGNDDLGSIGCNLEPHPGMNAFCNILTGLERRPDVEGVYALINEIDPGDGCWPFTDTVLVLGVISPDELRNILSVLQPDEVAPAKEFGVPLPMKGKRDTPRLAAWWD